LLDTTVSLRIPHKTLHSVSSLILQSVRSANLSVLQIRQFCKNSVMYSFWKSSVSSRNPWENAPSGIVALSAGWSVPRICSFRQNTITASAPLLNASVSLRNLREKHSARRRRSFRNAFDSGIRSNCSFPRETHAQMLYSASVLVPQIVGFARTASRARFATCPKSTRKRTLRHRRSFRKAFVPQISPFRKKSVTCSASFLVSRICSNSLFLTLAWRRRSNCGFLEEIRVKRALLGVVARSFVSLTFSSTWFDYARHRET